MADEGIVRRPAVPQPVRIRRDINRLATTDDAIVWYRRAIGAMKALPLDNPRGWRYQAAIHDYPADVSSTAARRSGDPGNPDPFARDGDPIPFNHTIYWRQCRHDCWFFIPWHRMYLHFFEKIVANFIVSLGGPSDWALPYWNYSASSDAAKLPEAFRNPQTADNHLFVPDREARANRGESFLNLRADGSLDLINQPDTNPLISLRARPFGLHTAQFGFGGPRLDFHPPGGNPGRLESVPHNQVHGALGGPGGFMSLFSTAPLDPMFWLHHCNIDRLWEVWVQRQKQQGNLDRNPKENTYLDGTPGPTGKQTGKQWLDLKFDFHDVAGQPTQMAVKETLDTRAAPLSYEYEDTRDPLNGAP
jgi:tyrosinase